jgi:hypothetical protein
MPRSLISLGDLLVTDGQGCYCRQRLSRSGH